MTKFIRGLVRYFKKRFAGAQIRSRVLAILAFAIFAYLGGNDAADIARSISNPSTMAQQLGITLQESTTRALVLCSLSTIICLASLATVIGAIQRTTLLRGWIVVTAAYVMYALVHLGLAILIMHSTQVQGFLPVFTNLFLAAAAYSFGRQASRALDPVVH